jgi:predicted AlkP superfamily pyrophosphatase or phosphodiesterase
MGTSGGFGDDRRFIRRGPMMRRSLLLVLFCLACVAGCMHATRPSGDPREPRTLILVSIDGFRADYLARGHTPTLAALAADGVRAEALKPSFPTLTFPNHYTLVTGLYPDHHGIVNNRMADAALGKAFVYKEQATIEDPAWWGGEPLWVSAEKQGLRSATMFWPGSSVAIRGVYPSLWEPFDGDFAPARRVDRILDWLDLPAAQRPRFLTLYFEQVDHFGHANGPDSPEVDAALGEIDTAIAHLVGGLKQRGLFDRVDLVIVSDHGEAATRPDLRTWLDDVVPLADIDVINFGILAGIEPHADRKASVEHALLRPHPHMTCWRKDEMPARLHYGTHPRIPSVLCLAERGGIVTSHDFERRGGRYSAGEHGYDNDDPTMRALFIARGPDFRRGLVVPEFDNVDVYPLLAHVLGIVPQPNDGDFAVVAPMLRAR